METIILRLMPPPLRRSVTPERLAVLMEFFRFGIVGLTGLVIDTAVVYGTRAWLGLYGAGVLSYLIAATVNWALNRVFTFRGRSNGPMHRQWAMFLLGVDARFSVIPIPFVLYKVRSPHPNPYNSSNQRR